MKNVVKASLMGWAMMAAVSPASAQEIGPSVPRIAPTGVEFVTGVMDFDISGTGKTVPVTFRANRALTNHLGFEFDATYASPDEQIGRTHLVLSEALLSYSWQLGRVRPFVSGGAGVLARNALSQVDWRPTFVGGGGARVQLNDRVYALGEMRLRGIGEKFSASTAEWLGGIGISFR